MVETHNAQTVGTSFVNQYYRFLHSNPKILAEFYHDSSLLSRPDNHGVMTTVSTKEAIKDMIMSLDYKSYKAEIKTTDAQESHQDGITVLVTGCLTGKDNMQKNFTQSFFLAPKEKGYYVQNDVLRYVEVNNSLDVESALENCTNNVKPKSVENNVALVAKKKMETVNVSECSNRSSYRKDGSLFIATHSDEKVVDVEHVQTTATLAVKENVNTSECINVRTDLQDGSLFVERPPLKSDMENVQNSTILNASEYRKLSNDLEDGSMLGESINLKTDVDVVDVQNNATLLVKKKRKEKKQRKKEIQVASELVNVDTELKEDPVFVEDPDATPGVEEKKNENPNSPECSNIQSDLHDGLLLVANPHLKRDVDVDSMQNNATLEVKKKKRKKETLFASEPVNVDTELKEGAVLTKDPDATPVVEKRKNGNPNASECSNLQIDPQYGLLLVENAHLNRDVDVVSEQNNATSEVKKKKKRKKENLVTSEYNLVHTNHKEDVELVENPDLKEVMHVENLQKFATIEVEEEKKENPSASEYSDIRTDLLDGSLVVENSPLKRNVDVEIEQNNATVEVKKKKRKKKKIVASEYSNVDAELKEDMVLVGNPDLNKNMLVENVINDATLGAEEKKNENPNASECTSLQDGSFLVENPPLKIDVDLESERNNATLEVKKRKKRKKEKLIASEISNIEIKLIEVAPLVENPLLKGDVAVEIAVPNNVPAEEKKKENPNASGYSNVHTDLEDSSLLVENPSLKINLGMENVQDNATVEVKKKKRKKKKMENVIEYSNVETDLKEVSPLDENPHLKICVDLENTHSNATLGVEEKAKDMIGSENCSTDLKDGSLLVENPLLRSDVDVESAHYNATLEVRKNKKKKTENIIECSNVDTGLKEGSPLNESSHLKQNGDVENAQDNATTEVKKKKRKKQKEQSTLEVSSIHNELEAGSLLMQNISPVTRDVTVETIENKEALVCDKPKKKKKKDKRLDASKEGNLLVEVENVPLVVEPRVESDPSLQTPLSCLKTDRAVLDSSNIKENYSNENISICPESKQEESKPSKKRRKLSESVGQNLKPVEEGAETGEVPKDVLMEEASFTCADGQPASKKRKSRRKTLKDGTVDSTQNNASVLSIPMDSLDNPSLDTHNSFQIVVGDAVCVEKGLNDPSACDPPLNLPEQKNLPVENIGDKEHFVSNLDKIEDVTGLITKYNRDPPQLSLSSPERSISSHSRKKLLILDLNGLLADIVLNPSHGHKPDIIISGKQVFRRPFCDNFLQFCLQKFDVGVWSSRVKRNVDRTISFLMGNSRTRLFFCWDQSHCTHTGFNTLDNNEKPLVLKELQKLWDKREPGLPWQKGQYNESNTLLLDDSPYKALRNPAYTAIFPESYRHENRIDCSLGPGGDLRVYLEGLVAADNVQEYVKQNPFGQKPITESDLSWEFYRKIAGNDSKAPSVPKAVVSTVNIC